MQVRLISITPEAESTIAYIARVSNPANQDNPNYVKLIKYLITHEHYSPFEMANMVVEVKTSRAITAQILRHRSFSFQEFSQRYSEALDFEDIEIRKQSEKNRQSSTDIFDPDIPVNDTEYELASNLIALSIKRAYITYKCLVESGVAKEIARMVLPMTTQSTIYMNGTIRSWMHYIKLRTKDDTQKEHRIVAEAIRGIFIQQLPILSEALGWENETTENIPE